MLYMSVIVLIPLAAVAVKAFSQSPSEFWQSVTNKTALTALAVTLGSSLVVAAIGAVMGTLVAWVLVRDEFPGKRFISSLIDLPFALPTIVAGLTLLALYGPDSPFGVHLAYTRGAVAAGAAVRDAAVRGALGAAGAARARPRGRGGGGVARRLER